MRQTREHCIILDFLDEADRFTSFQRHQAE
jgi:hypothetical protein